MKESIEVRIGRYLAREMNEQEVAVFREDLARDAELEAAFLVYQRLWRSMPNPANDSWDDRAAWTKFQQGNIAAPTKHTIRRNLWYWAAAAAILLVISTTVYYLALPSPKTYLYSDADTSIIELADGSRVHLNKGSSITAFPFTRKSRHVELSGEAFFEVTPDAKRPFTISCGKTSTEVVGTSFNLKELKDQVLLYVNSGKVIFRAEKDARKALALTAGEAAYFENNKMQMVPNPSPNTNAWHTHQLQLKDLPLAEAIKDISTYFGVIIKIENEELNACRAIHSTLPFKDPEIHNLLTVIAKSANARLVEEGNRFIIRGGNCPN